MSTIYFANSEIIILRQKQIGSSNRYAHSATYTAVQADIQPASPERVEFINGSPGHTFVGFVDTSYLINESDRVITLNPDGTRNKTYEVRGVSYWQGAGLLDHQELTLVDEVQ